MGFDANQSTYDRLRKAYAESRKPVTFWVGAGLSQPAGLPSWAELRTKLIAEALEDLTLLDSEAADQKEGELTEASTTSDMWGAFSTIRRTMGEASYTAAIRQIFSAAEEKTPPSAYSAIWSLDNVLGVVSLNIDRFADRAYALARSGRDVASFVGRDAHAYAHLIGAQKPFIANLHGVHQSSASWIFDREGFEGLSDSRYRAFLTALFSSTTVVFCGISADDQAAGGFLASITAQGIDLGEHYWISGRRDHQATQWSAGAGIQMVRYQVDDRESHESIVLRIISDLKRARSRDEPAGVIIPDVDEKNIELEIKQLRSLDDDDLRETLSAHAKSVITSNGNTTDSDEYRDFVANFSPVIHQAWHVTDRKPFNRFFGRTVKEKVSTGSFSNVWRIEGDEQGDFALKVLLIDNLDAGPAIDSFRRGVQSLSFLTVADVPGTARLIGAHEIPTAVVMRFIDGDDLQEIVRGRQIDFWSESIAVLIGVCVHLKHGHNLPHGVLHRDVRPSNIMLPYFYWEESSATDAGFSKYEAVLINYDMSWHADAKGSTIAGNLAEAGYYAPEQLSETNVSSRSTLVDSYGLGMTIYFAFTRQNPPTGGSRSADWEDILRTRFRVDRNLLWRSGPERLRRLIFESTAPDQHLRRNISEIEAELSVLQSLMMGSFKQVPADFWAEEIISRVTQREYQVSQDASSFAIELRKGRTLVVSSELTNKTIDVKFRNMGAEGANWKDADNVWRGKLEKARTILNAAGWEIGSSTRYSHMDITLHVRMPVSALEGNFHQIVASLEKGIDQVRLD